jgi:hypothetical protein
VSSSTGRAQRLPSPGGPEGRPRPTRPWRPRPTRPWRPRPPGRAWWRWCRSGGNGYATAALVLGILGAALVTIPASLACGVLGLLRAGRGRPGFPGRVRSWLGIGLALTWAALAGYTVPHLVRAADPGCVAYKGAALAAYRRVIDDFRAGAGDARTARDIETAVRRLDGAAAASHSSASGSLTALSAQLTAVLSDLAAGRPVPHAAVAALNRDSALADEACGTVRL